ncbi:MAG TPA: hypothetical protein VE978_12665 [Chitinophagales bacterium]|nr:hypothetical protein [Chitinophagales bacterium]
MDPITLIVSSLAAGAASGLKPTAEKVVKDAYEGIKAFIKKKFGEKVSTDDLERKPDSESKQASLKEDLESAGASQDQELLDKAKQLIKIVEQHDPAIYGVYLKDIKGRNLDLDTIQIEGGTGVRIEKGEFTEDIKIKNVKVTKPNDSQNPSWRH